MREVSMEVAHVHGAERGLRCTVVPLKLAIWVATRYPYSGSLNRNHRFYVVVNRESSSAATL